MVLKAVTVGEKALAKAIEKVEREKASRVIAGRAGSTVIRPVTAPRASAKVRMAEKTAQKEKAKEKVERVGCHAGTIRGKDKVGTRAVAKECTNWDIRKSGQHWIYFNWQPTHRLHQPGRGRQRLHQVMYRPQRPRRLQ